MDKRDRQLAKDFVIHYLDSVKGTDREILNMCKKALFLAEEQEGLLYTPIVLKVVNIINSPEIINVSEKSNGHKIARDITIKIIRRYERIYGGRYL